MSEMIRKKLPIGIESFEEIRTEGFYYIDKTGMIRDLLCNWGKVNLFTRPRRFGKSLNMSMLRCFFEIAEDTLPSERNRTSLFEGLEITEERGLCEKYMGRFPVISISLKGVNGRDYEAARAMMCSVVGNEAMRFQFLQRSDRLTDKEKELYDRLIMVGSKEEAVFHMPDSVLMGSLYTLSALLRKHYSQKVIVLIDEYDVPLAKANENGYYDETVCLLSKLHSDQHIEVELKMDELDLTAAESKATYEEIKKYVLEHTGLKVSNLYIAQVKQKCGIIERVNYNLPKSENSRQPKCPPEKEKAIKEALEYFRMI